MRKLYILTAQPDDLVFYWQTFVQLSNARENKCSHFFRVLVFLPHDRLRHGFKPCWKELEKLFPETQFFFYPDTDNVLKLIKAFNYIPLLRPHIIRRHYEEFPELSKDAIFYIDSDVLLHKGVDFLLPYIGDDIVYMSDGKSYNNSDYFDSKIKDVRPEKLEAFKKIDVLQECSALCGINRSMCEQNKEATGAAQYLLKGINASFWDELLNACCSIKLYLGDINRTYFISEDKGFQSWCADIFATNWLLWKKGIRTETPPDFNFAWATDPAEKWDKVNIYHDAGVNPNIFNKRKSEYINNLRTPFQDDLSWVDPKFCSRKYCDQIQRTKKLFNL